MIGERLLRARNAAGFSMKALGELVGVSANMIKKYEHNVSMPSSANLLKIAKAVGVRTEYFFRPVEVKLANVEYRKKANTPKKLLRKIESDVLDQAERWQELANIWPNFPVADFQKPEGLPDKVNSFDEIEQVARLVRDAWSLGLNPIQDIVDLLESHGILVIITDTIDPKTKFDGLQATISGKPIVVVSANWPGDRQRFTLLHELGHLLLESCLSDDLDEERACHRFASSFLLPAEPIRQILGEKRHHLEMRELYLLKQKYGLSMQAAIYRAYDLQIINEPTRVNLYKIFTKNKWKTQEPGETYPTVKTHFFEQLVYRALGEKIIGDSKAAELLSLSLSSFHHDRKLGSKHDVTPLLINGCHVSKMTTNLGSKHAVTH